MKDIFHHQILLAKSSHVTFLGPVLAPVVGSVPRRSSSECPGDTAWMGWMDQQGGPRADRHKWSNTPRINGRKYMGLPHAIGAFNVKLKHASPEACSLLAQGDSVAFKRCFQTINFRPHAIIWWFSIHPPQIWRMHNSLTTSPTSNRKKPWKMGWGVEANPAAQIGVTSANFSGAKLAAFNFRLGWY